MGLIKAAVGALGGTLADQWREYVYCDSLPENVLAAKGKKRTSDKRSSNTKGEDNILTNGSVIAVNEGQCMIVVDQGKVVELCGRVHLRHLDRAEHFLRRAGQGAAQHLQDHRQAHHFRRGHRQGPARLLLQHQGDSGEQIRHGQPGPLPRG